MVEALISDWLKQTNTEVRKRVFYDKRTRVKIVEWHFYKNDLFVKKTCEYYKRNKLKKIYTV